jgi:hypothetical protein
MIAINHFRIFIFVSPIVVYGEFNDSVKLRLESCGRETRYLAVQKG